MKQQDLFNTAPAPWEVDDLASHVVAKIVFSTGPQQPFDYLVPENLVPEAIAGRRMRVPFGRGDRLVQGYCVDVAAKQVVPGKLKSVHEVVDDVTLLSRTMLGLTQWMADYYLCPWGQVLDAVVPAAVRGNAGTREVTLLSVPRETAMQLATLKLPGKQQTALSILAGASRPLTPPELAEAAGCTQAPIMALRKKKLIHVEVRRISFAHFDDEPAETEPPKELNADQTEALRTILHSVEEERHQSVLLHGVTGSGKTEVYLQAIQRVVAAGKQAIVLVPEISLTPQTKHRFRARFSQIALLHSHMNDVERHWQWKRIASGHIPVVVGARSAIFAPTPRLGMIILDEEHDSSFKQDTAPRYHARDVAAWRAAHEHAPLILGSATPSLESWRQTQTGAITLVSMPRRVNNYPLPDVKTIDLRVDRKSQGRGAISRQLYLAMKRNVEEDGQMILLLNRRGYATHIQCPACGEKVVCPECEIPLTHHLADNMAICHYCDYRRPAPKSCPACDYSGIHFFGYGTQKLEAEVRARFPGVECLRMDSDTMKKPGSHEAALDRFRRGDAKILVGTQMIAKGLDFPNVTLVGVINADTALHFPDVRAGERTFQLITQVAGRTGRGHKGGQVLVQTLSPDHPAIEAATRHDYALFAERELPFREKFHFSPFAKMVRLVARAEVASAPEAMLEEFAKQIVKVAEELSLEIYLQGPAAAPIEKLRGQYRFHLLIKAHDGEKLREAVKLVAAKTRTPDDVIWTIDVDPVDMM
ncbi:primosomal protein N' [Blastopirellula sp. JC732]|uniref:Replication restart protein PriA n=1 Tax=Blastopirellula sediminis TaxID=2894196 RepID=A0A9X1MUJ1_9BACT|nr:primosomal protein N' [Blastopirellula sediminis]MCC9604837.1 primosomal protein N' [Blastopirellula sediminis]MCC9631864.1 primosomal protein N' [Blastopirellula sediminis]